jgi:hypothetical protein
MSWPPELPLFFFREPPPAPLSLPELPLSSALELELLESVSLFTWPGTVQPMSAGCNPRLFARASAAAPSTSAATSARAGSRGPRSPVTPPAQRTAPVSVSGDETTINQIVARIFSAYIATL